MKGFGILQALQEGAIPREVVLACCIFALIAVVLLSTEYELNRLPPDGGHHECTCEYGRCTCESPTAVAVRPTPPSILKKKRVSFRGDGRREV
jgi:hypothetical protein